MNTTKLNTFQAIILAAGKGSRMGSDLPKVLLPICSHPMITYILDSLSSMGIEHPIIVISKSGNAIKKDLGSNYIYALQGEQLGSGHAVLCARDAAQGSEHVLIMCGDSPLFRIETIKLLMDSHLQSQAIITLASTELENPHGYGRILRALSGSVEGIVEEKTATEEQKLIREVNGGCYAFDASWLWENIGNMHQNEAGEYCLTEMVDIAISQRRKVITVPASPDEIIGVNTPEQLRIAEEVLKRRGIC